MNIISFLDSTNIPTICLLIKQDNFIESDLRSKYVNYLTSNGLAEDSIIAADLVYSGKKASAATIKDCLESSLKILSSIKIDTLVVADSNYFKKLIGVKKVSGCHGNIYKCAFKGYEHIDVILSVNYAAIFYDPTIESKLYDSLDVLINHKAGSYVVPGKNVIHSEYYPSTYKDIEYALDSLHQYSEITCDIEAFSLRFNKAGIATIAFSWDEHNGVAFAVDAVKINPLLTSTASGVFIRQENNKEIKVLLYKFFKAYRGTVVYHNANYDCKVLLYELFMERYLDYVRLIEGLETLTRNIDDTRLLTYLATNSCSGNTLDLKSNTAEFMGTYAEDDIKDIRKIPLERLLRYNLKDCLATYYLKKKQLPIVIQDDQNDIYETLMKPSIKLILHTELIGMCISMTRVMYVNTKLENICNIEKAKIAASEYITKAERLLKKVAYDKDYIDRKNKAVNPDKIKKKAYADFKDTVFNIGSSTHLRVLLYEVLAVKPEAFTDTGLPSTKANVIDSIRNKESLKANPDKEVLILLEALIDYAKADKILTTFINAFIFNSILKEDGNWYLHGSFNIPGTVSGRLSSSQPNLQNLPSGSKFGKLIKSIFIAPKNRIFVGADFSSLEDRISALTTKDPAKLKVYTDGFDGHCLRSARYFGDKMLGISDTVESINSIAKVYPELRQASKSPTFLLTYGGTQFGIQKLGFTKEQAISIEANYHKLYEHSDKWVHTKLVEASHVGYVTVAFGLRVRTHILSRVMFEIEDSLPYEAKAEGRTAGNALGQSYGLLNNRAAIDFMERVYASKYRYLIHPSSLIHDAFYLLIKANLGCVKFTNDELTDAMSWQELDEIKHPTVKLSAELDIFYKSWATPITLKNNISLKEIKKTIKSFLEKVKE